MRQLAVEGLGTLVPLHVLDGDCEVERLAAPRRTHNHQWDLRVNACHSEQQVLQEGVCGRNALEELCVPVQVHAHFAERPVEWVCINVAPRDLACRNNSSVMCLLSSTAGVLRLFIAFAYHFSLLG